MKKLNANVAIKVLFLVIVIAITPPMFLTLNNYTNVMDAKATIPQNIHIEDVMIPDIEDLNSDVEVSVLFNVTNPTGIDIYVYDLKYELYMNNLSSPMPLNEPPTQWDNWAVGIGGFGTGVEEDYIRVPSGGQRSIAADLTVFSDTIFLEHLNVTDIDGNYHPFIIGTLRFTFKDVDVKQVVHNIVYYSALGVSPNSQGVQL
ncbi:MAG: hypothetical protein KAI64_05620 [Thermoplasmata archaeon]|nr:hypothetical protein [Thermoplasmata archaeon]